MTKSEKMIMAYKMLLKEFEERVDRNPGSDEAELDALKTIGDHISAEIEFWEEQGE